MIRKKILITGSAGFIGFHTAKKFLDEGFKIFGVDNLNNYYDINLKKERLKILKRYENFHFKKIDLKNYREIFDYTKKKKIQFIIHLAAQAGVRYSIENPQTYIDNNISAFLNLLEIMKIQKISKIIYASSSSVYGKIKANSFSENLNTNSQINMYAVSKKTNELMAHAYKDLYGINSIGLRFFTVYGPYGRPDMSLNIFASAIKRKTFFKLFNEGKMKRDFTYIDDVVLSIFKIYKKFILSKSKTSNVLNVGTTSPVHLEKYVKLISFFLNKKPKIIKTRLQKGDVKETISNSTKLKKYIKFKPKTKIKEGIKKFIDWFNMYYN